MTAILNVLRIWKEREKLATLHLNTSNIVGNHRYFDLNYENIPTMPENDTERLTRRRRNRRLLARIGDPEHGFPILKQLIETFGPMLMQYLLKQLPIWLADLDHLDDNTSIT